MFRHPRPIRGDPEAIGVPFVKEAARAIRRSRQERMRLRMECAKNREIPGCIQNDAEGDDHPG